LKQELTCELELALSQLELYLLRFPNSHLLRLQQYVLPVLPLSKAENAVRSNHSMTTTTATYITLLLFAKNKG
jgi:hypothetical protein